MRYVKFIFSDGRYREVMNNDEDISFLGYLLMNAGSNCAKWLIEALTSTSIKIAGANTLNLDYIGDDVCVRWFDQEEYDLIINKYVLLDVVNQWEKLEHDKRAKEIWIVQDDAGKYIVTDQDPIK